MNLKRNVGVVALVVVLGTVAWILAGTGEKRGYDTTTGTPQQSAPSPETPQIPVTTERSPLQVPATTEPSPAVQNEPLTFHGHICLVDCSGHEAGYQWAQDHAITDTEECSGNSESFIEGCKAYAEEHSGDDVSDDSDDK